MTPAIAETVRLKITLDPNAATRRPRTSPRHSHGVTNPIVFCIGQLPGVLQARQPRSRANGQPPSAAKGTRRSTPRRPLLEPRRHTTHRHQRPDDCRGQLDRYRFHAAKGQHLVIAAAVRELIPYISDAVPGWFQAAFGSRDAAGKEIAYADHYRFHRTPSIHYEVPADGQYTLEIHDSIYRGREDFVYRIAVGEFPYVTSIFPARRQGRRRAPQSS